MTHTQDDAAADLRRTPGLVSILGAELKTLASKARQDSPRWAAIDAEVSTILGYAFAAVAAQNPPAAVQILRDGLTRFTTIAAEEAAAREAEFAKARKGADDARFTVQREAFRAAWAERVGKETAAASNRLGDRLQRARERLGAIKDEAALREILGAIADALTSMSATLATESRTSIDREAAAAKAAA